MAKLSPTAPVKAHQSHLKLLWSPAALGSLPRQSQPSAKAEEAARASLSSSDVEDHEGNLLDEDGADGEWDAEVDLETAVEEKHKLRKISPVQR